MKAFYIFILLTILSSSSLAVILNSKLLRERAIQKKIGQGIYASLDLKENKVSFNQSDIQACRKKIVRQASGLKFSCELTLPNKSITSILNDVQGSSKIAISHAGLLKRVDVFVSKNAKNIKFTTQFDSGSLDVEFAEFNKEVYNVYGEIAAQIIAKAMKKAKLTIYTLEN